MPGLPGVVEVLGDGDAVLVGEGLGPTVPVHTTYQTAFVDDENRLVLRDDIYRHDAAVLAALAIDAKRRDTAREHRAAAATSLPRYDHHQETGESIRARNFVQSLADICFPRHGFGNPLVGGNRYG